jgi:hypothetical protein
MKEEGIHRVVFYDAGDVMEVAYPLAQSVGLQVIGIVDDDPGRSGLQKGDLVVGSPDCIGRLEPDAVVITTFRHASEIQAKISAGAQWAIKMLEL